MKKQRIQALHCARIVALCLLTAGTARADQLVGVVKSVDTDGRKVVVIEKLSDDNVDIAVVPATAITSSGGRPVLFKHLKKGDGVGITYINGVASVIVVDQAPVVGVIETIDPDEKTVVIDESGTDRDVKIAILPTTTIETSAGKLQKLKDLKSGDGVSVTYNGEDVVAIRVNVKPPELNGHVKSVAADLKSLVITEIGNKSEVKVAVTPDTTIVTGEGKTMELRDLKKGDGVGIAHKASVASKIVVNPAPAQ